MCGFAGFFNPFMDFRMNQTENEKILNDMCAALYHRGPDEN